MKKHNIIVALVVLIGSIALYSSLALIRDPRATTFPRLVILVMGALAVLLLLQSYLLHPAADASAGAASKAASAEAFPWEAVLVVLIGIFIYLAVMQNVGFYLSTFIFFNGIVFMLSRKTLSLHKGMKMATMTLCFTSVLYLLFNVLLKVQMPRGIFL